jgi:hypothetical protein
MSVKVPVFVVSKLPTNGRDGPLLGVHTDLSLMDTFSHVFSTDTHFFSLFLNPVDVQKKLKKTLKTNGDALGEPGNDDEVARMAKEFEAKYVST